jgi:multidrug efflux pump subunit AcrB
MILSDTAIRNRTTVGVLIAIIIVLGTYSYAVLPRESAPDVPIPVIVISTPYEGVAPEDIESSITLKIEKELAGLKGVKEIRSASVEGSSIITIEFLPDVSTDDAMQHVRDKVDRAKADLPNDAEEPVLTEINISDFPILMVNLSGPISPVHLKAIADDLEDYIDAIPGVLNCDVIGGLEREIRLEIDQDKVAAYGLTIPEIVELIPSENVNISAGGLETPGTKLNIRVPAQFTEPEEVDTLLIATRDGRPIYLTDVAEVRDTFKDRTSISRLNGEDTITLSVQKRAGENIIAIVDHVMTVLEHARMQVPAGVRFDVTLDQSEDIRGIVKDLENNMLTGLILVVGVLLLFLGWRPAMIVGLAIPMSMLLSFTVIQLLGYTLNMVVLFSLIMALGMLVDNAIVIVENVYRHYTLCGDRVQAAMRGTSEVAWPVITSTATTLAAFGPLMFWPDIMGEFMKYLPITLIITLTSSLFVALVISPTLASLFVRAQVKDADHVHPVIRGYRRILQTALQHRFTTLSLAVLLLIGMGVYYYRHGTGVELFPDVDPRRAAINIRCPQGTNIYESDRLARIVESRLSRYEQYFDHVITNVGSGGDMFMGGGGSAGGHVTTITLIFPKYELRERPSAEILAELRADLADLPGAELKVEKQEEGPPTGAAVTVRFVGQDFKVLQTLSEKAKQAISGVSGLVNLRSDFEAARPELAFQVDRRRAMMLGVNTAIIGNFLKTAVFGREVGKYRQFNDEYDITVRLPLDQRTSVDDLFRLRVPNNAGQAVPLSSLGEFQYTGGYGTIRRVDQKRVITLTGDAEGRLGTDVLAEVQGRLAELELPPGYEIRYAGEKEEQDKASAFLSKAFVIALLLITLILVAQFNSLSVPFMIMTTVILSLIGVFAGLLICRMPFGIIMTGVGVISLAGVVVNNAIVLLDYTRQLQARGLDLMEAAMQAGATRLRPVLLTAVTTVLGLIPMAVGVSYDFHVMAWATRSESTEWWGSMATAVIFGLSFATLLTLVVLPTLYVTVFHAGATIRRLLTGAVAQPAGGQA